MIDLYSLSFNSEELLREGGWGLFEMGCLERGFTVRQNFISCALADHVKIIMSQFFPFKFSGFLINIWNPPALSHHTADKFVRLDRVLIVGTSPSVDCRSFRIEPRNSGITKKVRPPRYKGGGNIGFMLSSFASTPGLAPEKPWHLLTSAPAIRGVVRLSNVGFAHFGTRCGEESVVFSTNPGSPDAFHPVLAQGISMYNVDSDKLFHIPPSNIGWINPSDCVDMDCDGAKHVLIKDLDGSLTGVAGGSVIPRAEYEWNGDRRRGLGREI